MLRRAGTVSVRRTVGAVVSLFAGAALVACDDTEVSSIDRDTAQAVLIENMGLDLHVEAALERVARVCMEDLGFDVHPPETEYAEQYDENNLLHSEVYTEPDRSLPPEEIYGVTVDDPAYSIVVVKDDGSTEFVDPDPFTELPEAERDAYTVALYGDVEMTPESLRLPDTGQAQRASGGCRREAEDALSDGEYPDYLNHVGLATARHDLEWEDDDRVVEARLAWSECMGERGYYFERPLEVHMRLFRQAGDLKSEWRVQGAISLAEAERELDAIVMATAADDAACHARADLEAVQETVFWEYAVAHVSRYEEQFYAFKERADTMLVRAQDIIESGRMP